MNKTYLLLGSNLGNSIAQLEKAKKIHCPKDRRHQKIIGYLSNQGLGKNRSTRFF
jgi:7,8-dihydro-6-hydroxymethylpterin-pyrophosphokinase